MFLKARTGSMTSSPWNVGQSVLGGRIRNNRCFCMSLESFTVLTRHMATSLALLALEGSMSRVLP